MNEMMAFMLFSGLDQEPRSALPHAPVFISTRKTTAEARMRSQIATILHKAAWRIEPTRAFVDHGTIEMHSS
ncbi:hypothetical protein ACLKOZ_20350 [Arthrobacter sp. R4]